MSSYCFPNNSCEYFDFFFYLYEATWTAKRINKSLEGFKFLMSVSVQEHILEISMFAKRPNFLNNHRDKIRSFEENSGRIIKVLWEQCSIDDDIIRWSRGCDEWLGQTNRTRYSLVEEKEDQKQCHIKPWLNASIIISLFLLMNREGHLEVVDCGGVSPKKAKKCSIKMTDRPAYSEELP